jgi:DnaK suppressor protein
MNAKTSKFDQAFLEQQRRHLDQLRSELLQSVENSEADETGARSVNDEGSREYEEDAQKLAALELDENLVVRDIDRLERVERALAKLEEGTYGVSDISGQWIARDRLEAIPDAVHTLEEEQAQESQR